eukprot:CAMPEP_0194597900 /NCGR_PEP_ID=MMETSP0292-20121207/26649_1 /TAXON_ID=39354 /ORGANISM="Heterosigma akashiwo, Strain CCMP2393" /LENGTH=79 /DNA_ID=CAMNT_0039458679 /DNA_START=132 /DNA_END=368 /DNA_ORIENTATION=-
MPGIAAASGAARPKERGGIDPEGGGGGGVSTPAGPRPEAADFRTGEDSGLPSHAEAAAGPAAGRLMSSRRQQKSLTRGS